MILGDSYKIHTDNKRGIFASVHKIKSKSENAKTGDMTGLYILPIDEKPTDSIKGKRDDKQCGDCLLKRSICYVNPVSVNSPWRSQVDQPETSPDKLKLTKPIRLGVYGDPAFVPFEKLSVLTSKAPKWTGYTHQWHKADTVYSRVLMASVDNLMAKQHGVSPLELKRKANKKGYRTFRVIDKGQEIDKDEIECPNTTHGVQCADCGLCSGTDGKGKADIFITIHGPQNKVKTYQNA